MDDKVLQKVVVVESAFSRAFLAYEECRNKLNTLLNEQRLQIAMYDPDVDNEEDARVEEHKLHEKIENEQSLLRVLENELMLINELRKTVCNELLNGN
jgi:hypothetical protein